MRQGWVNLSHTCFRIQKYPKLPNSVQNLSQATYFDVYLAIESKNILKWGIFLMLLAIGWQRSSLDNSSQKTSKFQILSYKRVIYLKRKLRSCTIRIQQENNENLCKKIIFLVNIFNFLELLDDPQKI